MADFTNPQGPLPTDTAGYRQRFEQRMRDRYGRDVDLTPESPLGGLTGIMALSGAELDEVGIEQANALSLLHARGRQLDDLISFVRMRRQGATRSTVTATLAGVAGTVIPARSRVKAVAGAEFRTIQVAVIAASGSVSVAMEAVEVGPVPAAAGALTQIVTLVTGWETATNPADAILGRLEETDRITLARQGVLTMRLAAGPIDAVRAALLEAGTTAERVKENNTSAAVTVQSFDLPAHSLMAIVRGGEDADIALAIKRSKGIGVVTFGGAGASLVTLTVQNTEINFRRVAETRILVAITTTVFDSFPANGLDLIRQNLVDYALGEWEGASGQFETAGLGVGRAIDERRLQVPAHAVPGHDISAFAVTDGNGVALPATPNLDVLYTLASADITITTT